MSAAECLFLKADDESLVPSGQLPPIEQISEETFGTLSRRWRRAAI
jgi:hypothetical protein